MQPADAFISLAVQSYCTIDHSNELNARYAARAQQCKRHEAQRPRLDCITTHRLTTPEKRLLQEHVAAPGAAVPQRGDVRHQSDTFLQA